MMTTLTITAKGQVTFKQSLLKHLGVGPGQKIEADMLPDGRVVVSGRQAKWHYVRLHWLPLPARHPTPDN